MGTPSTPPWKLLEMITNPFPYRGSPGAQRGEAPFPESHSLCGPGPGVEPRCLCVRTALQCCLRPSSSLQLSPSAHLHQVSWEGMRISGSEGPRRPLMAPAHGAHIATSWSASLPPFVPGAVDERLVRLAAQMGRRCHCTYGETKAQRGEACPEFSSRVPSATPG